MTYLWQEERGKKYYKIQTDEKEIARILKRRNKFTLSAVGLNKNIWIYSCEFSRPDIAKKVLNNVTRKKGVLDSEGVFVFS